MPYEGFDTTMGERVRLVRTTRSKLLMIPMTRVAPMECKVGTKHSTAAATLLLPGLLCGKRQCYHEATTDSQAKQQRHHLQLEDRDNHVGGLVRILGFKNI